MYYFCDICSFNTNHLPNYNRHCSTKKHQRNLLNKNITFSNHCNTCNQSYKCSDKYHKTYKCKPITNEKKQELDMPQLVFQILEQNKELMGQHKDLMIQNKELMGQLISNKPTVIYNNCVDNSTINNTVNLFLNEDCKDAINWDEFIVKLELPSNIDSSITDIVKLSVHNQLKQLGMYKRPIHCLDMKTKQLCIKNKDNWEEDSNKNHKLIKESLDKMKNNMIKNWENKHPNWNTSEQESEICINMLTKIDEPVNSNKCIQDLMKHTFIELE